MTLDPKNLLEESGVEIPPIGLYDAPDPAAFEPLVRPSDGKWACVFMCKRQTIAIG